MFCGPPVDRAELYHTNRYDWDEVDKWKADMKQDLRFYEDQLYNVHSSEYHELYQNVIPRRWKVWGSLTRPVGSNWASHFLVSHSLCRKWWEIRFKGSRRVARRDCACTRSKCWFLRQHRGLTTVCMLGAGASR